MARQYLSEGPQQTFLREDDRSYLTESTTSYLSLVESVGSKSYLTETSTTMDLEGVPSIFARYEFQQDNQKFFVLEDQPEEPQQKKQKPGAAVGGAGRPQEELKAELLSTEKSEKKKLQEDVKSRAEFVIEVVPEKPVQQVELDTATIKKVLEEIKYPPKLIELAVKKVETREIPADDIFAWTMQADRDTSTAIAELVKAGYTKEDCETAAAEAGYSGKSSMESWLRIFKPLPMQYSNNNLNQAGARSEDKSYQEDSDSDDDQKWNKKPKTGQTVKVTPENWGKDLEKKIKEIEDMGFSRDQASGAMTLVNYGSVESGLNWLLSNSQGFTGAEFDMLNRLRFMLPSGWMAAWDKGTRRAYYIQTALSASSWVRPAKTLPQGWSWSKNASGQIVCKDAKGRQRAFKADVFSG
eukprot:TRINITY_DN35267_c0_g1_i1.p1 TRINITY_DN35267_c0_g1~~TRINITY_DN35267_c0_g1_i1.p1  ORF type:complete len:426 (+),score=117.46 TRINITY_DN35267_c0_g1_i1:48-1280(+)